MQQDRRKQHAPALVRRSPAGAVVPARSSLELLAGPAESPCASPSAERPASSASSSRVGCTHPKVVLKKEDSALRRSLLQEPETVAPTAAPPQQGQQQQQQRQQPADFDRYYCQSDDRDAVDDDDSDYMSAVSGSAADGEPSFSASVASGRGREGDTFLTALRRRCSAEQPLPPAAADSDDLLGMVRFDLHRQEGSVSF